MDQDGKNPGGVGAPHGAEKSAVCKASLSSNKPRQSEALRVRIAPDGEPVTVRGREAQTLRLLIDRGAAGVTSGEASPLGWARRTSAYVLKLRRLGFPIETSRERIGDANVGRYRLTASVSVEAAP
jgi:hypothetical protein